VRGHLVEATAQEIEGVKKTLEETLKMGRTLASSPKQAVP